MSARNGATARLAIVRFALGALVVLGGPGASPAPSFASSAESGTRAPVDLAVNAPSWLFSRDALAIDVAVGGSLEGRRLSVLVFVDDNLIETYPTAGAKTRIEVAGLALAPGVHDILVKSGTFEARDRFRVVSPLVPTLAGGLLVIVGAAAAARKRRRARTA